MIRRAAFDTKPKLGVRDFQKAPKIAKRSRRIYAKRRLPAVFANFRSSKTDRHRTMEYFFRNVLASSTTWPPHFVYRHLEYNTNTGLCVSVVKQKFNRTSYRMVSVIRTSFAVVDGCSKMPTSTGDFCTRLRVGEHNGITRIYYRARITKRAIRPLCRYPKVGARVNRRTFARYGRFNELSFVRERTGLQIKTTTGLAKRACERFCRHPA